MSHKSLAIRVRGLSKSYSIAHGVEKHSTLAETVVSRLKNPFNQPQTETFWALKEIDFDIKKGEVVGIIGRNGAGKSTLLKILSRITEPTSGEVDLFGRVGSLLEVGTGFHPELTGRENIYLNGAILGMAKSEIRKEFDAIVDFAGVEKFLDTPVKRYSSGMYVRLAFAVAAHLRSEILIVDEVLSVGDAEFQRRCLGKMEGVAQDGRSVIFVSHDTRVLRGLCTSGIFLRGGRVAYSSNISSTVDRYLNDIANSRANLPIQGGVIVVTRFDICQGSRHITTLDGGREIEVNLHFQLLDSTSLFRFGIYIKNSFGEVVCRSFQTDWEPALASMNAGNYKASLCVPARVLMPGSYRFCLHASRYGIEGLISENDVINEVTVSAPIEYNAAHPGERWEAAMMLDSAWQVVRA